MQRAASNNDDATDVTALHQSLVDQVKTRGYITSPWVEAAFRAVPRHLFLPDLPPQEVYQDKAISTKSVDGLFVSSSSQPTIMAIMLEQLDLQPGQRVLEIGAGTGYNAALMAHIVGKTGQVVTIDIDQDIVEGAQAHLAAAGYAHVQVICADGGLGFATAAPYDRIILTVNSSDITPAWREQLKPDGRLLLPLVIRGPQVAVAFEQVGNHFESVSVQPCGFVGLRGAFAERGRLVQLASEPGLLFLTLGESQTVDVTAIKQWLSSPAQESTTPIQLTFGELFSGLSFWLAVHEPQFCHLFAQGAAVEWRIVPNLYPAFNDLPTAHTLGLLGKDALSVLKYGAAQEQKASSIADVVDPLSRQPLQRLHIYTFGNDKVLVQHLSRQIAAWDEAGRPNEQQLHIQAYPNGSEYVLYEQNILIKKQWTSFVLRWEYGSGKRAMNAAGSDETGGK